MLVSYRQYKVVLSKSLDLHFLVHYCTTQILSKHIGINILNILNKDTKYNKYPLIISIIQFYLVKYNTICISNYLSIFQKFSKNYSCYLNRISILNTF